MSIERHGIITAMTDFEERAAAAQIASSSMNQPALAAADGHFDAKAHKVADSPYLSTFGWLHQGWRAGLLRAPQVAGFVPRPMQLLVVILLTIGVELAVRRLEIVGPARFSLQAWASNWWSALLFLGLAWWLLMSPGSSHSQTRSDTAPRGASSREVSSLSAWMILWLVASLPSTLAYAAFAASLSHGWITSRTVLAWSQSWTVYLFFTGWSLAVSLMLLSRLAGSNARLAVSAVVMVAATGVTAWQFNERAWDRDYAADAAADADKPRLRFTQQVVEEQQSLWQRNVAALAAERAGVADVYGLVFAPFASEDVFLRESTLVAGLLADRFDAAGRVVHLLNHGSTSASHVWATPLNLQRAITALGQRMDRDNDLLVVYLTSHGARDFRLAASHWPLEVEPLTPADLRAALDQAGIRNRVIAVSACYSGGWIDALAGDSTLVMTAADATHTSYGCGRLSSLTFFGRALFDEQLRQTHSFEKAFAAAVPLIRQREIDAGKDDGFSNPQIRVGEGIRPVLSSIEERLQQLPKPPAGGVQAAPATGPSGAASEVGGSPSPEVPDAGKARS